MAVTLQHPVSRPLPFPTVVSFPLCMYHYLLEPSILCYLRATTSFRDSEFMADCFYVVDFWFFIMIMSNYSHCEILHWAMWIPN
jgi:hypothetical protein